MVSLFLRRECSKVLNLLPQNITGLEFKSLGFIRQPVHSPGNSAGNGSSSTKDHAGFQRLAISGPEQRPIRDNRPRAAPEHTRKGEGVAENTQGSPLRVAREAAALQLHCSPTRRWCSLAKLGGAASLTSGCAHDACSVQSSARDVGSAALARAYESSQREAAARRSCVRRVAAGRSCGFRRAAFVQVVSIVEARGAASAPQWSLPVSRRWGRWTGLPVDTQSSPGTLWPRHPLGLGLLAVASVSV